LGDGSQPDDAQPDSARPDERRGVEGVSSDLVGTRAAAASLDRRFRISLVLYAVLGLLVWFTMGEGKVLVHGRPVELRLVPLIVIGGLALRTLVAHQAERIRRQGGDGSGNTSS
jgi:hypothetical protein